MESLISFADRVISLGSKVHPIWLRKWFFSFVLTFGLYLKRVVKIVKQVRLNVSLVQGRDKRTGKWIYITLVSNDPFPRFLSYKLFSQKPSIKQTGKVFVGNIPRLITASSTDTFLVSCDRFYKRFLHKKRMLVFPVMVDMVLETTQPVQFFVQKKYVSHSVYTDIQIIKKFDYSFKISNDIEKIHMFYHSMYLPMIQKRHGDHLLYTPPFVFLKYLKEAGYKLLLIMDNTDAPVSGVYFHETPKEMFIRYAGILNGDMSLMNKGASAAYYYYSILYAEDKGIEKVNVGGVRPFFGDGVFQYKRKWGLKVVKTDGAGYPEICGLYIPPCGSPLEQFLIDNPFIGVDEKNNHVGYFFFIEREQITIEQKKMLHEKYATPGIEKFQFISFDEYCGGKIEKMRSVI